MEKSLQLYGILFSTILQVFQLCTYTYIVVREQLKLRLTLGQSRWIINNISCHRYWQQTTLFFAKKEFFIRLEFLQYLRLRWPPNIIPELFCQTEFLIDTKVRWLRVVSVKKWFVCRRCTIRSNKIFRYALYIRAYSEILVLLHHVNYNPVY